MEPKIKLLQSEFETKENLQRYVKESLKNQGLTSLALAKRANLSTSEVSRIKNGIKGKFPAKTFYCLYSGFGHTCEWAVENVFPKIDLTMEPYKPRKRNSFGKSIESYEKSRNTIEEISAKTTIDINRMKELYFEQGSPEAHELLLIERALDLKMGTLFSKLFKSTPVKEK